MIWYLHILWDYHYDKPGNHLSPYKVIIVLLIIFLMLYIKSLWLIYFITRSFLLNPLQKFDPTPISILWQPAVCSLNLRKLLSHVQLLVTPWTIQSMEFSRPGVSSYSLLQGIFPTQGLNPGLPHCRWILYQLSHQGSSCIYESASTLFCLFVLFCFRSYI